MSTFGNVGTISSSHALLSPSLFREAMSHLPASVAILTSFGEAGQCGITVSSLVSATDDPPTLSFYIKRDSLANGIIRLNRDIAVNLVNVEQWDEAYLFGRRPLPGEQKTFDPERWDIAPGRAPKLRTAALFIEGAAEPVLEVGTHTLFLLRPSSVEWSTAAPGVYHRRTLHMLSPAVSAI